MEEAELAKLGFELSQLEQQKAVLMAEKAKVPSNSNSRLISNLQSSSCRQQPVGGERSEDWRLYY